MKIDLHLLVMNRSDVTPQVFTDLENLAANGTGKLVAFPS